MSCHLSEILDVFSKQQMCIFGANFSKVKTLHFQNLDQIFVSTHLFWHIQLSVWVGKELSHFSLNCVYIGMFVCIDTYVYIYATVCLEYSTYMFQKGKYQPECAIANLYLQLECNQPLLVRNRWPHSLVEQELGLLSMNCCWIDCVSCQVWFSSTIKMQLHYCTVSYFNLPTVRSIKKMITSTCIIWYSRNEATVLEHFLTINVS